MFLLFTVFKTRELNSKKREVHWLFISAIIITFIVYIYPHFNMFQNQGIIRATHGRYYYIVFLPFAYLLLYELGNLKSKFSTLVPMIMALALGTIEFHAIYLTIGNW